jgi:hypothetical protein
METTSESSKTAQPVDAESIGESGAGSPPLNDQTTGKGKGKGGAPIANINAFRFGHRALQVANRKPLGRARTRARRVARDVVAKLTVDIGGSGVLSEQERIVVGVIGNQAGRYDRMMRAYEALLRKYRNVEEATGKPNPANHPIALAKLESAILPLENTLVANVARLGMKRAEKQAESLQDYLDRAYGDRTDETEASAAPDKQDSDNDDGPSQD